MARYEDILKSVETYEDDEETNEDAEPFDLIKTARALGLRPVFIGKLGNAEMWKVPTSPAFAQILLTERNPYNRPLNRTRAYGYARDMAAGAWRGENGECIGMDTERNLINGQHRLAGVIESGKTIDLVYILGLSRDVANTLDTGKPRSFGDRAAIEFGADGRSQATRKQHAAVVRVLGRHVMNVPKFLTHTEIDRIVEEKRAAFDAVCSVARPGSNYPAPFVAAFVWAYPANPEMVVGFLRRIVANDPTLLRGKHDPACLLQNKVRDMKGQGSNADRAKMLLLTLRAILAELRDDDITRLHESEKVLAFFAKANGR